MTTKHKSIPFLLSLFVILADQYTKWLIADNVPINGFVCSFFGDLVQIVHVRNTAIAFGLGTAMPQAFKTVLFSIVPFIVLVAIVRYLFKADNLSKLQRWAVSGIIGGGFGNLIDRVFRPLGVVDFVDVKFFGLFGLDRWPTFNVADIAIVVCGILLTVSFIFPEDS